MAESQDKLKSIIAKMAERVTPNEKERSKLDSITNNVSSKLKESFANETIKPEIMLGGSFAKGTWLPGSGDIDFFMLYPVDYSREKLETDAIEGAKRAVLGYKINMRFAEHPYVEAFVDEARVNLVPCYKVERGSWQSAVDRSPYHTQYVQRFFNEKLRLETRLLKSFAKGIGVYGAEVKTQGFSGYVCEVLALRFGSFEEVLKHFSEVKKEEVISIESFDQDIAASFTSPVIILDPVDTARNLGSAISTRNLAKFILHSRRFLANPSLAFFFERKPKAYGKPNRELIQRTVVLKFKIKPRSVDVLWGQLYKSLDALSNRIESWGFKVLRKSATSNETDECAFIFLLHETEISKFHVRNGPDVYRKDDFVRYVEKNDRKALLSWLDSEGRILSIFEREKYATDVSSELKKTIRNKNELASMGLSKGIQKEIQKARISSGTQALASKSKSQAWLRQGIFSLLNTEDELRNAAA